MPYGISRTPPAGYHNEYRIFIDGDCVHALIYSEGNGYQANLTHPFTDTTDWHSLSLAWKDGEKTQFTLDGTTIESPNVSLNAFTSSAGLHSLGGHKDGDGNLGHYYDGMIRNATVHDVFIPEPSTLALLATGLIGLLCHAWRKRK